LGESEVGSGGGEGEGDGELGTGEQAYSRAQLTAREAAAVRQWLLVVAVILVGGEAWGDGMFSGSWTATQMAGQMASPAQRAVVVRCRDGRELMIVQPTYRGPGGGFVWLIPVPGLPRVEDIRAVGPQALDWFMEGAEPIIGKAIHQGGRVWRSGWFPPFVGNAMAPAGAASVTVHDEIAVGDYHAAILSATGGGVLEHWLRRNGYALPAGAEQVLGQYVGQGWHFVALKLQAPFAAQEVSTADLQPLALLFPAEKLVYPLAITRLSAAPSLALRLAVVSDEPMACTGLAMRIPEERTLPQGETYAEYIREVTRPGALFREEVSQSPGNANTPYRGEREAEWLQQWMHWTGNTVCNFRAVLPRDALQDVYFVADPSCRPYMTQVHQEAWARMPWYLWPTVPWVSLPVLLALGIGINRRVHGRGRRRVAWGAFLVLVLLLVGFGYMRWCGPYDVIQTAEMHPAEVGRGVENFVAAHGCLPQTVSQIFGSAAAGMGQDGAGNPVPFSAGSTTESRYPVPVDILTGCTDTWVIDPTAPEFVTSRGWQVTVRPLDERARGLR
jgi:hypothetical protein